MNVLYFDHFLTLVERYGTSVYWDIARAGLWQDHE
jgi:hypothetical protein